MMEPHREGGDNVLSAPTFYGQVWKEDGRLGSLLVTLGTCACAGLWECDGMR